MYFVFNCRFNVSVCMKMTWIHVNEKKIQSECFVGMEFNTNFGMELNLLCQY
jgi:hypothetical protein